MSELSLKSAKSLFNNLGQTIIDIENNTDRVYHSIQDLEKNNIKDKRILNVQYASLFLNYIYLDFCASYRLYLSGLTNYEQRYAIKQLYVILNEGHKCLYGFDNKQNTVELSTTRKNSIWYKYLRIYQNDNDKNITHAYEEMTLFLQSFKNDIIFDQTSRAHGAHYNFDYNDIYNHLCKLDAEKVTQGAIQFMSFLEVFRKFIFIVNSSILPHFKL